MRNTSPERLEQFHEVAGRVADQRLPAASAGDRLAAERHAGVGELGNGVVEIIDLELQVSQRHALSALAGQGCAESDPASREFFQGYSRRRRQRLTDVIAAGVADGEFPARVNPDAASVAPAGALFYRRLATAEPPDTRFIAALIDTVLGR